MAIALTLAGVALAVFLVLRAKRRGPTGGGGSTDCPRSDAE